MSFTAICWLIVKICLGIIAVFLTLGFIAKRISKSRLDKLEKESTDD